MEDQPKYKITAKTVAEFISIRDKLEKLPKSVLEQIEFAEEKYSKIRCKFFTNNHEVVKIRITNDLDFIDSSNEGFSAGNSQWRFEMLKNEKQRIVFEIINQ